MASERERERADVERERTRASKGDRCHHVKGWGSKARRGETRRATPVGRSALFLVFSFISLTSSFPSLANQPTNRTNKQKQHVHYSHRAPWLRAAVLGANDGLVSTASLMLGVGGGTESLRALVLAGVAGLVAGALSMAVGEYISVSSQRDAEEVKRGFEGGRERKRREEKAERELTGKKKGNRRSSPFRPLDRRPRPRKRGKRANFQMHLPAAFHYLSLSLFPTPHRHNLHRPTSRRSAESRKRAPPRAPTSSPSWPRFYEERGLTKDLALAVAKQLTERDVIRAHARDELGIDLDDMSNPLQAAFASSASFTVGAAVPLLAAAFIQAEVPRLLL